MTQAVSKSQLGSVVSLLSALLVDDRAQASTALGVLDEKIQWAIHGKLWELMGSPDHHEYGRIAFSEPSKLAEALRPTVQQKCTAINNYLMTFPSYVSLLQVSIKKIFDDALVETTGALIPGLADGPIMKHVMEFITHKDFAPAASVSKAWNNFSQISTY